MKVGAHHEPMYLAILLLSTLIGTGEGYVVKFRFEPQSQCFKSHIGKINRNARSNTNVGHLASIIIPYRTITGTTLYETNVNSQSVKDDKEIERENDDHSTTATTITTVDSSPHPNGEDPVEGDDDTTTAAGTPSTIKKSAVTPIKDKIEDEASVSEEDITSIFQDDDMTLSKDELFPSSPPLSFGKFLTMQQEKRVVVTINYSQEPGLRPFFLTAAKRIKTSFPDVLIEKNALPNNLGPGNDQNPDYTFEILVDGKTIVKKSRSNKKQQGDALREMSVFVSMAEIESAISKARKRRRPGTLYKAAKSSSDASTRLEMLRVIEQQRRKDTDTDI